VTIAKLCSAEKSFPLHQKSQELHPEKTHAFAQVPRVGEPCSRALSQAYHEGTTTSVKFLLCR